MITYYELLDHLNKDNTDNHLLLANGFNSSLGVYTRYEDIFDKMRKKYNGYDELDINNNYDIEHIIGELKNQTPEDSVHKKFLDSFINNKVKSDFMKSAYEIAKEGVKEIYNDKNHGVGILFKNFTNFFTLNYDPFLYLLLMKYKKANSDTLISFQNTLDFKESDANNINNDDYEEIKNIYYTYTKELVDEKGIKIIDEPFSKLNKTDFEKQLREILKSKNKSFNKELIALLYEELKENEIALNINDGFVDELFNIKPEIDPYIQNVFFLHGSFHLYRKGKAIYKITKTQDKALYDRLDEILGEENKEIITVFTNENKVSEIENNDYLIKCIDKLKTLSGSLVIIGSSLDENDNHIFDAIKESPIKNIFYASNDKEKTQHYSRLTELFPNKEITLYDRDTVTYEKSEV